MRRKRSGEHGGSTFLEFVLVGVPVIFVMFSTFEMARGMWSYHSLAYAVREGTRYAIVHGASCSTDPQFLYRDNRARLPAKSRRRRRAGRIVLNLTFTPNAGTPVTCTMNSCL